MTAKYQVTGTVTYDFDVDVTAADEDDAARIAAERDYAALIESAGMPRIQVDGCSEIPKKRRAKP